MPSTIPFVVEQHGREERAFDIYSALMKNERIIFLTDEVDDEQADRIIGQLLYLTSVDDKADIKLYINSPGGSVTAGMAIYDVMNYVHCDVQTVCLGIAASMAATLLAAGTKGKRFALPHAEVMIHQVLGGARGPATDIEIRTRHLVRTKQRMNEILAKLTGQPLARVEKDTDRDNFMTALEALEYGLVDHIVERMPGR